MAVITDITKFIEDLESFNPMDELSEIVRSNGERLVELQQEQLAAGIDNTGQRRVDEYLPFTVLQKELYGQGLGAETDRVTFYMTGELYSLLHNEMDSDDVFQIRASNFKFDKMIERIGDDFYGLDEVSRLKFAEEITLPQFEEALLLKVGLEL